MNSMIEILGVAGAVLLLAAYWLVSSKSLPSNARESHLLNFIGASLIALNSGHHGAWVPALLNVVWALRGLYGMLTATRS
jgi:hypothetical protein